ncbi:hypothetical protein ACTVZO_42775 [Streptomyces sp. IBSNAI002]|uniref:hypothetical protein n=1 Tax=Streptomyces sp. IBSNAI002 TaxID=3457500 RepID=UPI003FD3F933
MYAADGNQNAVYAINTSDQSVTTLRPVNVPSSIAVSPDGKTLFTASTIQESVAVIDTTTFTVTRIIPMTGGQTSIAAADNSHAYAVGLDSNSFQPTFSVIDAASESAQTVPLSRGTVGTQGVASLGNAATGTDTAYTANDNGTVSTISVNTSTTPWVPSVQMSPTITVGAGLSALIVGQVTISPGPLTRPSLTLTKTASSGNLVRGREGQFTISVANEGDRSTVGQVTVTDRLPQGVSVVGLSGPGWNCTASTLSCTRNDALSPGASYPDLVLEVKVLPSAPDRLVNTATLTADGDDTRATATATVRVSDKKKPHHHKPKPHAAVS